MEELLPRVEDIDWSPVLAALELLEVSDPDDWARLRTDTPGMPWYEWHEDVDRLHRLLYDQEVVTSFDWPAWMRTTGREIHARGTFDDVSGADARRLLAAIARGERFTEGLFVKELRNGTIPRLLRRIADTIEPLTTSPRTASVHSQGTSGRGPGTMKPGRGAWGLTRAMRSAGRQRSP